jgi:hypothetical protein
MPWDWLISYDEWLREALLEYSCTFGPKIAWLKDGCEKSGVMEKYKAELERIYADMTGLLKKRNYLTHGETYEASFKGKPKAPYGSRCLRARRNGRSISTLKQILDYSIENSKLVLKIQKKELSVRIILQK